jgi:hypothetical protein
MHPPKTRTNCFFWCIFYLAVSSYPLFLFISGVINGAVISFGRNYSDHDIIHTLESETVGYIGSQLIYFLLGLFLLSGGFYHIYRFLKWPKEWL